MKNQQVTLIYDKQCPLCENYCQMVRIQASVGKLILIDARTDSQIMQEITDAGLDIDQGMVLKVGEVLYYGESAIHALAMMSSQSGFFNRVNHWLFRSKVRSKISYPVFKAMRNLLLKILNKTKINNLRKTDNQYF